MGHQQVKTVEAAKTALAITVITVTLTQTPPHTKSNS